jgi:hypothetical protein
MMHLSNIDTNIRHAAYIIIKSLNFYLKKLHGGIRLLVLKTDGSIVLTEVLNMSVSPDL